MTRRTALTLLGAFGIAAAPATAAATSAQPLSEELEPQPLAERTTIRLGIDSKYENLLPFWLAEERGEFDAENLDVDVTVLPPSDTVLMLARSELDAAVNSVNAGVMNLVAEGLDVRYVFPTAELPPDSQQGLWVRVDAFGSDGEFQPTDLAGAQILTTTGEAGSTAGFIVDEFQAVDPGFEPDDVEFMRMAVGDLGPALMNGAAPAAFVPTPFWPAVRDSGCCEFVEHSPDLAVSHILFGSSLLDGDRDVGMAFLRAMARTQVELLQGDYHADASVVADAARLLEQPIESIESTPSLIFSTDFRLNGDELIGLQEYFLSLDDVLTYDEPLTVDDLWDASWTDELAGRT